MPADYSTLLRKSRQQLRYLHQFYYQHFTPVTGITMTPDFRDDKRRPPIAADWTPVAIGAQWSGRDKYFWLHFATAVPAELSGSDHFVLHMDLGRTGDGNNDGFEGLVFVNDAVYQAVDSNHRDLYLTADYAGTTVDVQIKLWSGLEGGGQPREQHYVLQQLHAGIINQTVVDAYDYLHNVVDVLAELGENDPLRYSYMNLLNQVWPVFEWNRLTPANVGPACAQALALVRNFIAANKDQKPAFHITAVGHTHIDVAWLWRLRHTREKVARSFSTVLELMREYPEYTFFHSTPQEFAFLEEDYPELFAKVQDRVAEGRWEAGGSTWLEPDANIPNGESLTRQFLYGTDYFKTRFNARQNVLWLPDVFGYSAALPQILQQFGVQNFATTKISWNETNRMPFDTFNWEGIDGSKVLTHFITTTDPLEHAYTYNGQIMASTLTGSYAAYKSKLQNDDILVTYGFGDGGGGPTREQIRNMHILNELPGMPVVTPGHIADYFDRMDERVAPRPDLPLWRGELYLEFHRGTYTSQARIKNWNRRTEYALRALELRYATATVEHGTEYPTETIAALWRVLLRNQFHDILPGSSIAEVYADAEVEFTQLFTDISTLQKALDDQFVTTADGNYLLTNTLPFATTQVIQTATAAAPQLVHVPALSSGDVTNAATAPLEDTPVSEITTNTDGSLVVATPFHTLTIASTGAITSLQDKTGREFIDGAAGGNQLAVYEDRPLSFSNWNLDADYVEKETILQADSVLVTANNALFTELTTTYAYHASTITQTTRFYAHTARIDYRTHADWHESQTLLRTVFNTTIHADNARYDIQYGNTVRPITANNSWEAAKFETAAHKWADLANREFGLALLNNNKYGYSAREQQLGLTLIKSGNYPDPNADQGSHDFTYAILPHTGDWITGDVEREAAVINEPLRMTANADATTLTPLINLANTDKIALDAVKISEDGQYLLVRIHDFAGEQTNVELTLNFAATAAFKGTLAETVDTSSSLLVDGAVQLQLHPYEVATIALTWR